MATAPFRYGADYSEKAACSSAGFRFDFFSPEEATAVEFAFGLHNPRPSLDWNDYSRRYPACVFLLEKR